MWECKRKGGEYSTIDREEEGRGRKEGTIGKRKKEEERKAREEAAAASETEEAGKIIHSHSSFPHPHLSASNGPTKNSPPPPSPPPPKHHSPPKYQYQYPLECR